MKLKSELAPKGMEFKPTEFMLGGKYSTILTIVSYPKNIMLVEYYKKTSQVEEIVNNDLKMMLLEEFFKRHPDLQKA